MPLLLVIILVVLLVAAAVLIALVILTQRVPRLFLQSSAALPKQPLTCDISRLPRPGPNARPLVLGANVTGGQFTGSNATVPAGVSITLTRSLTVIVDGDLIVDGTIDFPLPPVSSPNGTDITLVSLNGTVRINGGIGAGLAAPGSNAIQDAFALGGPGVNAGTIKIVGINIDVQGTILGNEGGRGGLACATGRRFFLGPIELPVATRAIARGSQGGFGGEVLLCALESINIGGNDVRGGAGGGGGPADAVGLFGGAALAQGGDGNVGGDVIFSGTDPSVPCQVFNAATIEGGEGGVGGCADARSPAQNRLGPGGAASGSGGSGGSGGTVRFDNCIVARDDGVIQTGDGGEGGDTDASGGGGSNGLIDGGYSGGNATATGGNGGALGVITTFRIRVGANEAIVGPAPGQPGSGGTATATPGAGGAANLFGAAGAAGTGNATGGSNGAGAPATPVATPPSPAISVGAP